MPAWIPPGRAVAALTRLFAAISILALEMQAATWLSIATIHSLTVVNAAFALLSAAVYWRGRGRRQPPSSSRPPVSVVYILGVCLLAVAVLALNAMRPVLAADPYHLGRMTQFQALG